MITQRQKLFRCVLCFLLPMKDLAEANLWKHLPFMTNIDDEYCSFDEAALGSDVTKTCIESPIETGMKERCFYTYIPECASEDSPLVYDLHGFGGCPEIQFEFSGWKEIADEQCFVLVLPVGNTLRYYARNPCWATPSGLQNIEPEPELPTRQCCCFSCYSMMVGTGFVLDEDVVRDDLFLRLVASYVVRDVPVSTGGVVTIDTKRIYFAGHSNGCLMAQAMAMLHSDLVTAVACHAGTLFTPASSSYDATPIWSVHGTKDEIVPYNGQVYPDFNQNIKFTAKQSTFEYLSELNECASYENNTLTGFSDKGFIQIASNCTNNATVEFVTLMDVGHYPYPSSYFDGQGYYPELPNANPLMDYESTRAAWTFVSGYESSEEPDLIDI